MTIVPIALHPLVYPDGYSLRCRGCRYSRAFAGNKFTCEQAAARHRHKYPWHTVAVFKGSEEYLTLDGGNQLVIESADDEVPF